MKLNPELAEAIIKLRPYPAFQKFLENINQDGIEAMLSLVKAPMDAVGRLQGKAEEAQSILGAISGVDLYLEKLNRTHNLGEHGHGRSAQSNPTAS